MSGWGGKASQRKKMNPMVWVGRRLEGRKAGKLQERGWEGSGEREPGSRCRWQGPQGGGQALRAGQTGRCAREDIPLTALRKRPIPASTSQRFSSPFTFKFQDAGILSSDLTQLQDSSVWTHTHL